MLSLPEQLKYVRKGPPGFEATALLYLGIGTRDGLLDDLTEAAFDRVFLGAGWRCPRTRRVRGAV